MDFKLTNTSEYLSSKASTDWWRWTACILGDPSDLDQIDYVDYRLHSSFSNPIRRVRKRDGGFPLSAKGWGTFTLEARVVFKDCKREPVVLKHELEFEGAVAN